MVMDLPLVNLKPAAVSFSGVLDDATLNRWSDIVVQVEQVRRIQLVLERDELFVVRPVRVLERAFGLVLGLVVRVRLAGHMRAQRVVGGACPRSLLPTAPANAALSGGALARRPTSTLSWAARRDSCSFNQLIGLQQQRLRDGDAESGFLPPQRWGVHETGSTPAFMWAIAKAQAVPA